MSRWTAIVVAALAIAGGLASEYVRQVWLQPLWVPLTDLAIGWLLVGCGLVASVARPNQPAGRRLVLAGFLWIVAAPRQFFADTGQTADFLQLTAVTFTLIGWSDVVIAFIALSFAGRSPARRRDRVMVGVLVAVFASQTVARILGRGPEIFGTDLVDPDLAAVLVALTDIARICALAVAGVLIVLRWLAVTRPGRHLLGPVLLAGAASALAPLYSLWYPFSQLGVIAPVPENLAVPSFWVTNAIRALVPIGMLAGILRQRASRSAVADAIASVGPAPSPSALAEVLAQALRDPSLRVLTWDESVGAYVDEKGRATPLPASDANIQATIVTGGDRPLAALVHDRALGEDPALLAAGVAVTRLVVDNTRLSRELRQQLDEVRQSRARIVEAGDAERRRIERDLHDGVQQRLLALALALRGAEGRSTGDPEAAEALRLGTVEALGVVEDVRELAQGIHPAVLSEAGLGAALRSLADRSPVPVDLSLELDGLGSSSAVAAAYFVASEALANVVKHAAAGSVRLVASDHDARIKLVIEDDGAGGAAPAGAGLRGLADRVAALGGALTVDERPGGGTILAATIPIE